MANKILKTCIVITVLISLYVGSIYYASYGEDLIAYVSLVVFNAIRIFTLEPVLELADLAEATFGADAFMPKSAYHLYVIAVYMAPICTAGIIMSTVRGARYTFLMVLFRIKSIFAKDSIAVFGQNDMVRKLIENEKVLSGNKRRLFYVYTNMNNDIDEKLFYINNDAILISKDKIFVDGRIGKQFVKILNKISCMFLFNEDTMTNFSELIKFDNFINDNMSNIKNDTSVYCYAEEYNAKTMINEYIDELNAKRKKANLSLVCNYETFDLAQLRVRAMLNDEKHMVVKDTHKANIHNVIIGFGRLGKAIFDEILNESVYNQDGIIDIDILSNDMENEKNYILNKISYDYVYKIDENHLQLSNVDNRADGILNIYFHNVDINDKAFYQTLASINDRDISNYIDNIYICAKVVSTSIQALNVIQKLIKEKDDFGQKENINALDSSKMSIYIRLESDTDMVSFIDKSNDLDFKNTSLIKSLNEILSIDTIINEDNIKKAIKFNYIYNYLASRIDALLYGEDKKAFVDLFLNNSIVFNYDNAIKEWKENVYVNREASWYQALHTKVKKYIIDENKLEDKIKKQLFDLFAKKYKDFDELLTYLESILSSELMQMIKTEHRRWNYNKAFNGFSYKKDLQKVKSMVNGKEKTINIDKVYKLKHNCLLTFDELLKNCPDTIIYDLIPLIYIYMGISKN